MCAFMLIFVNGLYVSICVLSVLVRLCVFMQSQYTHKIDTRR